jgi:hypothetical protein
MEKARGYGFIIVFFVLTLLPLAVTLAGISLVAPVDEKRKLAEPPKWQWPVDSAAFLRQATIWFDDNFGLRSLLIRLKTQIDLSVFSTSDRVYVGSGGQLFYRSVIDVEKPAIEHQLKLHEAAVLDGIRAFNDALLAKGIHTIFVVNLMSDRFIPETLPKTVPRQIASPRIDDFVTRLAAIPNLTFVDATSILKQEQAERPIFHKTDFHWNDPAAFGVASTIVERIANMEGRTEPVWEHGLEIETKTFSGGIASFLPVFFPPTETGLFVKKTWTDDPAVANSFKEGIFEYVRRVPQPDPKLLPTVVVVGDSFFDGITRSGFPIYFDNLYRARWNTKLKVSDIAAALPPDARYVVVQCIEVNMHALLAFADKADVALATDRIAARPGAIRYGHN